MPNKPAPLTAEEITTAKCLMSGCNSAPWHSAGTIVRNEDDQDICVIEERFQWNPGHGKRPTCDVVADAQAIAEARNNYPRAIATIEQQREQIAALSAFVGSFTPPTIQALQAKCTALEKERDRLAQKNLDCREVLVTLFINEGNTEEIARLSVQEVLGEASCPN